MTLIANDFAAIAQRLAQIKRERDGGFVIPDDMLILLDTELGPALSIPKCRVCLVLHEKIGRMSIMFVEQGTSLTAFVRLMMQHYHSIRMINGNEIYLSGEDARSLSRHLRLLRR